MKRFVITAFKFDKNEVKTKFVSDVNKCMEIARSLKKDYDSVMIYDSFEDEQYGLK